MKKLVFLVVSFLLLGSSAFSQGIQPPDFSEFYQPFNVTKLDAYRAGGLVGVFKKNSYDQEDQAYWNNRRMVFNSSVNNCNAIWDAAQRVSCYMQLRQIESQKTLSYRQQASDRQSSRELRRGVIRAFAANTAAATGTYSRGYTRPPTSTYCTQNYNGYSSNVTCNSY